MSTVGRIEEFLSNCARSHGHRAVIVGKGPSFSEFRAERYPQHFVVGLNEVALRMRCHAAFVIDEEILRKSGEALAANVESLIAPRVMHQRTFSLGGFNFFGPGNAIAKGTWNDGIASKLRTFNLSTASEADAALGGVHLAYSFSAPTLANLLAACGFMDIVLCGVDGGTRYSRNFEEFEYKKLTSVQEDFNIQFRELREVKEKYGTRFTSIRFEKASVLVGAEPEQSLCAEVLRWSIDRHTFLDVDHCETPSVPELPGMVTGGTSFSFQRLYLPELAGGVGRGMYFDSDMLVFKDVFEVFNVDMGSQRLLGCEATAGREAQLSMFLVDNERAGWSADQLLHRYAAGQLSYRELIGDFAFARPWTATLPVEWNSLEHYVPGRTANCHFTDMPLQPWLSVHNLHCAIWCEALLQASTERASVRHAFEQSIAGGWVRPSLGWQMENVVPNPMRIPKHALALDQKWVPPHGRVRSGAPSPLRTLMRRALSCARSAGQTRLIRKMTTTLKVARKVFTRN